MQQLEGGAAARCSLRMAELLHIHSWAGVDGSRIPLLSLSLFGTSAEGTEDLLHFIFFSACVQDGGMGV